MSSQPVKIKTLQFIGIFCLPIFIQAQKDWQLEKSEDHITIYTQNSESGVKRYKAITHVKGSIAQLAFAITDTRSCLKFMDDITDMQVIETQDSVDFVYCFMDMPWPVSNRDIVLQRQLKWSADSSGFELLLQPEFWIRK